MDAIERGDLRDADHSPRLLAILQTGERVVCSGQAVKSVENYGSVSWASMPYRTLASGSVLHER